jgi:hypothetical protein
MTGTSYMLRIQKSSDVKRGQSARSKCKIGRSGGRPTAYEGLWVSRERNRKAKPS